MTRETLLLYCKTYLQILYLSLGFLLQYMTKQKLLILQLNISTSTVSVTGLLPQLAFLSRVHRRACWTVKCFSKLWTIRHHAYRPNTQIHTDNRILKMKLLIIGKTVKSVISVARFDNVINIQINPTCNSIAIYSY